MAYNFYEFFAGGGMARAGLGSRWSCLIANDFDPKKATAYEANWGGKNLHVCGVADVKPRALPSVADLAWASFPCQDLSLAGAGAGLKGERSGTFWPFWKLMKSLVREGRAPKMVVLENVLGALTSHGGKDFAAIGNALSAGGYRFGAVVIDAVHFVPQSRPRLFIIGVREDVAVPAELIQDRPDPLWHPPTLIQALNKLPKRALECWLWWNIARPPKRTVTLADIIEEEPSGVAWHSKAETMRLLGMMSEVNFAKVKDAKRAGTTIVGGLYKRTRQGIQRAEVRFDGVSGCLRTPAGGSSRQTILIVDGNKIRSRLLSPREAARLMGLPEKYKLPSSYNEAYHLAGDGVVVPVVRFLADNVLEPMIRRAVTTARNAA